MDDYRIRDYSSYINENERKSNKKNLLGWTVGIVSAVILLIIGLPYIAEQVKYSNFNGMNDKVNRIQEPQGGGPPPPLDDNRKIGLQISTIMENPEDFIGRTVSLSGEVDEILSPNVIRMDQERTIAGDEILIISRTPVSEKLENTAFEDDYEIQVRGTVRRMSVAEIERDLLELNLEPEIEAEIERRNQIVIIVDAIRINMPQKK